jgi:hypothetical protein
MGNGQAWGFGANTSGYIGMAFNVRDSDDYKGISAASGITFSVFDVGLTLTYFWNSDAPPLTPCNVQGFSIGYSPGANFSIWNSVTDYTKTWSSQD